MADTRRIEYVPLDELQPAPRNPKQHDLPLIRRSIERFGFAAPGLRDERTGRTVAGHGRAEALRAMRAEGHTAPAGILVTGDGIWMVPVIAGWSSRSDAEAEAYLVLDNTHSAKAGWDNTGLVEVLGDLHADDRDLFDLTGYSDADLEDLLDGLDDPEPDDDGDSDPGPSQPPAQPVTVRGDVWLLGRHRLMCGDCTEPGDLDQLVAKATVELVYTDPPYGISIVSDSKVGGGGPVGGVAKGKVGGSGKVVPPSQYLPVAGDESTDTARSAFALLHTQFPKAAHVWWGGNHYAGSAGLPDSSCWLVWDKQNDGLNFADCELAWTNHDGAVRIFRHMWNGMLRASERGKRVHPTQKPVALAEWAFGVVDAANARKVVLDVFGGSGSTLMAAHNTGRTTLLMELEAAYVDVIAKRFQEATGITPVLEATGEQHDFIGAADD